MKLLRSAALVTLLMGATALTAPALLAQDAEAPVEASQVDDGLLAPDELDELFSPVALYPDALLAQILLSATYPLDVVKADSFISRNADKSPQELSALIADQTWAEPVRGLAAGFPDVVGRMVEHLDWTEMAGNALVAQTDDSLASLQRLRAQAKLNGYLEDNAAMNVEQSESGNISIASADPAVVYVPQYTETVYTTPAPATPVYVTDDDDWDDWLATGAIVWGSAMLVDEIFDDDDWDDWGDYWHGDGGGIGNANQIDWDGDINIDNGINIGNGIVRPGNGDGLGGAVAGGIAGGIAGGALTRPKLPSSIDKERRDARLEARRDGRQEGRLGDVSDARLKEAREGNFRPSDTSREAAREKIRDHKATGAGVSKLPAAKGKGDRAGDLAKRPAGAAKPKPATPVAKPAVKKPAAAKPAVKKPAVATPAAKKPAVKKPAAAKPKVSKPKVAARPTASNASAKAKRQPSFKPSNGSRAKAAASRGKSSRGGRR